ncbi:MAG TPA: hypothetical protein VMH20_02190 [Verrucomicrobiae bacterium]|nr:hypothetical protein [Verrucomicrobiae bacterium]
MRDTVVRILEALPAIVLEIVLLFFPGATIRLSFWLIVLRFLPGAILGLGFWLIYRLTKQPTLRL